MAKLSDDALRAKTVELQQKARGGANLDSLLVESFAVRSGAKTLFGIFRCRGSCFYVNFAGWLQSFPPSRGGCHTPSLSLSLSHPLAAHTIRLSHRLPALI
jgi:hypothetical protein